MHLTYDQIKQIAFGALEVTKQEDGYHFSRFTDSQVAIYKALSAHFNLRAGNTAGCRLEFHTDSNGLILEVGTAGAYEVLIDGLQAHYLKYSGKRRYSIALPEGDTHVTVLLPWDSEGVINMMHIDDGSYLRPHTFDHKILFLGDSITQGFSAKFKSLSYSYLLAQHLHADFLNWAVGGFYFHAPSLEDVGFDPDIVVIAYGTNDYTSFKSPEAQQQACAEYLKKVKALYGDKQVFCISPLWRADGIVRRAAGSFEEVRARVIREIEANGFIHIDGLLLHPHSEEFFADGCLHPNDYGFSVYARNLIRAMEPYLQK